MRPPETKPLRLWTREAAPELGLAVQTLRKLRVTGGGPRFRYEGRRVYYLEPDLREWLEARRSYSSTAEKRAAERLEKERAARSSGRPEKGKRVNVRNGASGAECTSAPAAREAHRAG